MTPNKTTSGFQFKDVVRIQKIFVDKTSGVVVVSLARWSCHLDDIGPNRA